MTLEQKYLTFYIDQELYGVPISSVEKVIRAVELINYPEDTEILKGFINMAGHIIPVVNICKCLGLEEKDIDLDDRLVILKTRLFRIAVVVDEIYGIVTSGGASSGLNKTFASDNKIVLEKGCISQIENFNGTSVRFCDPDKFLTDKDVAQLGIGKNIGETVFHDYAEKHDVVRGADQ